MDLQLKNIGNEQELAAVLKMCYRILGEDNSEMYGYDAWRQRLADGEPLLDGEKDVVSAVLGHRESGESLVVGFVACEEEYQRQEITRALMERFEQVEEEVSL